MDLTNRLGDGRRDNNYRPCPKCPKDDPKYWKPRMHIPPEGKTNIVKCWNCGHEEPRFSDPDPVAEKALKAKKHHGSRRVAWCSCESRSIKTSSGVVFYDEECPIHGLEA